nr:MAG TPA: hypothetical protein [Caudoviricetes sp.]
MIFLVHLWIPLTNFFGNTRPHNALTIHLMTDNLSVRIKYIAFFDYNSH